MRTGLEPVNLVRAHGFALVPAAAEAAAGRA
jgi:hypothetical protein